jgi:hypothetical protein
MFTAGRVDQVAVRRARGAGVFGGGPNPCSLVA